MSLSVVDTRPSIFCNLNEGKKQTVIVYGTSLTAGSAWSSESGHWFNTQYPGLVTFINSAGPGQNSGWGLQNLKEKVLDHHPDLIFIEFSYNDAHEKFNMPLEKGAENLGEIVNAIQTANPAATVVLQIMNIGWDAANGNRSASVRPQLEGFNNNYRAYAKDHNLPLLDHYSNWLKLSESDPVLYQKYIPDGSHPTDAGSLAITWPTVKTWLEKSSEKPALPHS